MSGVNQIAIVEIVEALDSDRVRCWRIGELWGAASEDQIDIRFGAAAETVRPGERYVIAYSRFRRNPLLRGIRELDPNGPSVVELAVVGKAVFPDRPEVRLLFGDRPEEAEAERHLAAALTLTDSEDERLRRFAIAEIALDRELRSLVAAKDGERLQAVIADPAAAEIDRELLLLAAAFFPESSRSWLEETAAAILREGDSTELDLGSLRPALILRALETLAPAITAENQTLFARWLSSNAPGVVKAALAALDDYDTEVARRHVLHVLEEPDLESPAHRALIDYLNRSPQPWDEN